MYTKKDRHEKEAVFEYTKTITFLRWHYPDQVLRSTAYRLSSQPGFTKLPLLFSCLLYPITNLVYDSTCFF